MRAVLRSVLTLLAVWLAAAGAVKGGDAGSDSLAASSFLERLKRETDKAAAAAVNKLRARSPELFRPDAPPVAIGVFPAEFPDGGVLALSNLFQASMIEALGMQPGVAVMGERAFANAPYALKGSFTPPVEGLVNFTCKLDLRDGDVFSEHQTIHTESFVLRLPDDDPSRHNLFLYVQRPEGQSVLPELDVPLLEVGVEVAAVRRERDGVKEISLPDGDWLCADDQFRVCLKPNTDCYAYIFLRDSVGDLYSLFPSPGIGLSNRLEGGVAHWVPESTRESGVRWFYLDDNPGNEILYIVAGYEPIHNVDELLAGLSGGRESASDVEAALGDWAVTHREESHRRFRVFDGARLRRLDENFSLVRKFTIEHR